MRGVQVWIAGESIHERQPVVIVVGINVL